MATLNSSTISRVSANLHQLLQMQISNTKMMEKNTQALRKKIKVDINLLIKDLSKTDREKVINMVVSTVQDNFNNSGSTTRVHTTSDCLSQEGSHESGGIAYEDGGAYGGVCAIGSMNGLTGGGLFGGFNY